VSIDGKMQPGFPREKTPPAPKKKAKKRPRENYSQQCDVLFARLVRAPGVCADCGSTKAIQCAHGFSRRYRAIRWNFYNAFPLCASCHMKYTYNPLLWDEWLRKRWGIDRYQDLRSRALNGKKPDLKVLLVYLDGRVQKESA
jgi:hypothetical protein